MTEFEPLQGRRFGQAIMIPWSVVSHAKKVEPVCRVFHECGGCQYQDIPYSDELALKETALKNLLREQLNLKHELIQSIMPSPAVYHYRSRLDLKLFKTKSNRILIGFSPMGGKHTVEIDECPVAHREISDFLPALKRQAIAKLPERYQVANLVVRSADEKKVLWGGIGQGSLKTGPQDYFWTEINNRKIFYSLETFFQANLSILPDVVGLIRSLNIYSRDVIFFDLYGGVGLFGISLADLVKRVVLIEESKSSVSLAKYNLEHNKIDNIEIHGARVEDQLPRALEFFKDETKVLMVDPPRAGLSSAVVKMLNDAASVKYLLYLSCNPQSLVLNLMDLTKGQWQIEKIFPLDFFPRTKHLETLVVLKNPHAFA